MKSAFEIAVDFGVGRARDKHGAVATAHLTDHERLAVLTEEVGEIARALQDGDERGLREELIDAAAVIRMWWEATQ